MVRTLLAVLVHDREDHVPTHYDLLTHLVFEDLLVAQLHDTAHGCFKERLLTTLGNAANVERPHCQLCTRFTDGLCGDDADSFADVDPCTA